MIWLSATNVASVPELPTLYPNIGVMLNPNKGNRPTPGVWWAADTGLYSSRGEKAFRLDWYLNWLERWTLFLPTCLFATAPDKVGDAVETWARSHLVLPRLRAMGYPAAFVAQDGQEHLQTEWDSFDVLFVGGTTAWKMSEAAYGLVAEAKRRGKKCHMGRVNSAKRLRAADMGGYDSADGSHLVFHPTHNLVTLMEWFAKLERQPSLPIFDFDERT